MKVYVANIIKCKDGNYLFNGYSTKKTDDKGYTNLYRSVYIKTDYLKGKNLPIQVVNDELTFVAPLSIDFRYNKDKKEWYV